MGKIILSILAVFMFSIGNLSFAINNSFFKNEEVKPLVEKFIKQPTVKDLVKLLNKEFNKDILSVTSDEKFDFPRKNLDLTEDETYKLKNITSFLTEQLRNRKDNSDDGVVYIVIVKMEFDL